MLHWRTSSLSKDSSECVELAPAPETIHIRDSKDPDGPRLTIDRAGWHAFAAAAQASEFSRSA